MEASGEELEKEIECLEKRSESFANRSLRTS